MNQMCKQMYDYRRTRHQQAIPPYITSSLSTLLNKLTTQKRLFLMKPKNYRKMQVVKMQNSRIEAADVNKANCQENRCQLETLMLYSNFSKV